MKNIRFVIWFMAFVLLFTVLVGSFVYAVDPLQLYRKASYSPLFTKQQRYQNPGLAKSYAYDTIILGSSMTENFVPSEVGELLGGKVMKLSMEGSTAKEQRMIADVAVGTGQVKKVLWGIDYFSFRDNAVRDEANFPFYLYDDKVWNDYKYLLNVSDVKHALGALLLPKDQMPQLRNLDLLNNWDASANYGPAQVYAKWQEARLSEQLTADYEPALEVVKQNFEENTMSFIEAHPDIEFIIYYPPYSVLRQQMWYSLNPERFDNQLEMKKYMYERFSAYDNVRVYDFQSDSTITYDLDEYKDLSHHSAAINRRIVEEIADGTHQVTAANVELNNRLLQEQVQSLVINEDGPVYSVVVNVNGQEVTFSELPPADDDQVRVPLKDFALAAGIEFNYDAANKTASLTRGDREVKVAVGADMATVNGTETPLETPTKIYNGRLTGPLLQIIHLLQGDVEVDQSEQESYIVTYNITLE
ncbi:MAG: copper amine oxidase N-terminal domain-containing protein [Paenibacillaceae bacterium]|uniref:Copper amine oxidase N-terminal domain-containing protein n=1 Tax=Paenibacillus mellifer TaxID=2937794 RepID=A0A9X2BQB0_9BACL|nr:copper amine oxidase N-terminal domain-containing protein [Paenibacillus mellifer]MBW4840414.1 copper amine oxidase N-terminal domain-containing protein [Paenibacillaceae bacterium]MCK8488148.1 copper amine oxidase N-terminal domain-containing protein [Paenibacillus mellifer]